MISDSPPREACPAEVGSLSAALAAAFEDDPVFSLLLPRRSHRLSRLVRFFKLELRHIVLPAGRVWTADGTPGGSLELPPGTWKMPINAQLARGPAFARVFGARLAHAMALITPLWPMRRPPAERPV